MPAPSIRPSREEDVPAIASIYAHHVRTGTATFELDPPGEEEMSARWRNVSQLELPWIVAEIDGAVVGYAYATTYRPRPAYRFTVENSVYVEAGRAGMGIGRTLLDQLIRACESTPVRQMIAVIGDSANTASIRLHERCGFRHVGVLQGVGFKFDRWLDTVFMQRPIAGR